MAKNSEITVKDVSIKTMNINGIDYICITDIAKQKNIVDPNGVVANWMRNRNTIEYLGLWETLHNTEFNPLEFEGFRKEAGLNANQKGGHFLKGFLKYIPELPIEEDNIKKRKEKLK
jgi:hypothetical protein